MEDKEARYKGDVHNCVRHGRGQYKYPFGGQDMFMYAGNWKSGVKNAAQGIFVATDVFQYVGEFKDGSFHDAYDNIILSDQLSISFGSSLR